jgi:glycosyltransferase involved in cell wall biosynthesis
VDVANQQSRGQDRVLITVSGTVDPTTAEQVRRGERPQPDYLALARATGGELLDVPEARRRSGRLGRVIERVVGRAGLLAWVCFRERHEYGAILTDGEQVGLPFALLCRLSRRRCAHVMIVHILSVRKKVLLFRTFGLRRRIDRLIVYSSWQQRYLTDALDVPAEHVVFTPFTVDTTYFAPGRVTARPRRMICSAGLELRDYPTLIEAVRGLDVLVVIAAASNWSKRADSTRDAELPDNVEVCSLGYGDLRQLYADAELVVMPLHDVEFQAGVTTILEGMAMGKAIVCSRTRGQTDVVVEGESGVYVTPGDSSELRRAIEHLLADPGEAARLGQGGRRFVTEHCDVPIYAERLAAVVRAAIDERR